MGKAGVAGEMDCPCVWVCVCEAALPFNLVTSSLCFTLAIDIWDHISLCGS